MSGGRASTRLVKAARLAGRETGMWVCPRRNRRGRAHTDDSLGVVRPGGPQAELAKVILGLPREGVEPGLGALGKLVSLLQPHHGVRAF